MAIGNQPPPTKKRIEEEKEGEIKGNIHLGLTEVIDNPSKTKALFIDLIKSAKSEILLILPTVNAFLREYRIGALQLFREISTGVGTVYPEDSGVYEDEGKREEIGNTKNERISIRILTPTDDVASKIIDELITSTDGNNNDIQIRYVQPKYHITTATIMIIDRKISLVLEKVDDAKEEFNEAVGLSTYSTSSPTVASYVSIFENFWDQIELYEEHKAKDRLEREFINLVAHELRTPTQAVLGYMELALMETDNDITHTGNVGPYIVAAFRNALRLQRLTKDILDIARIESNTLKLSKVRLDLVEKINDAISDIRHAQVADRTTTIPTKDNTNTKIEFIKPDRLIFINADGLRIQEVITNLLSNAINATRNNNSTSSITVSIQVVEGSKSNDTENGNSTCVIVRIKDNGKGIDPEIMPRLFTKFVTKFESGLGLGLYISKSIIKTHGGKIWAENNKDGNGATFNFSLPLSNN
jgi:two-component system, OmpR family, sensor histidine kinase VicK